MVQISLLILLVCESVLISVSLRGALAVLSDLFISLPKVIFVEWTVRVLIRWNSFIRIVVYIIHKGAEVLKDILYWFLLHLKVEFLTKLIFGGGYYLRRSSYLLLWLDYLTLVTIGAEGVKIHVGMIPWQTLSLLLSRFWFIFRWKFTLLNRDA